MSSRNDAHGDGGVSILKYAALYDHKHIDSTWAAGCALDKEIGDFVYARSQPSTISCHGLAHG